MEHVARLDLEPLHLVGRPGQGQDAEAGPVVVAPAVGQGVALHRQRKVEEHGQVVEDHRRLGDRAVVDHRVARDRDVDLVRHPAVGADHRVVDHLGPLPPVARRVELAGARVALGVGGEAVAKRPVQVREAHRVELVGELGRAAAGLDDGEGLAGQADHVGVRHRPLVVALAGGGPLTQRLGDRRRADPAVAVPLGSAVAQADAVHHALAGEPVVVGGVDRPDRVGPVAEVAPVELGRERAGHLEVEGRHLLGHRGVEPLDVPVGDDVGHGWSPSPRRRRPLADPL